MSLKTFGQHLGCVAIAGAIVAAFGSASHGAIILKDSFTYPNGNLVGNVPEVGGAWTNHSGTTTILVDSGQAKVDHTRSEDANAGFSSGAIGAGDTIYAAFDLTVPAQTAAPGNVYFAHFKDAGNFFGSRVWISAPAVVGNGYRLGITGDGSLEVANDLFPTDLAFGATYRVVTKYDFDSGDSMLWVNPSLESDPSVTADDTFAGDDFTSFALRQSTQNSMQLIDNLVVATSFGEALTGVQIPEPATLSLVGLAGVALCGAARRRK
jgi:hypothetical protein